MDIVEPGNQRNRQGNHKEGNSNPNNSDNKNPNSKEKNVPKSREKTQEKRNERADPTAVIGVKMHRAES